MSKKRQTRRPSVALTQSVARWLKHRRHSDWLNLQQLLARRTA